MLTDIMTKMTHGFVAQYPVGMSCPCPARSMVQQPYTVRYKATPVPLFLSRAITVASLTHSLKESPFFSFGPFRPTAPIMVKFLLT